MLSLSYGVPNVIPMPSRDKTHTCGVCSRPVREDAPKIDGLGEVGDDCHRRVREFERAFTLLKYDHPEGVARAIVQSLRKLGLNAAMRYTRGRYRVIVKGGTSPQKVTDGEVRSKVAQKLLEYAEQVELEEAA